MEKTDQLNGFRTHGVALEKSVGKQAVGDCPFCQKEGHFYANKETKLWDCKRCLVKGNFEDFLGHVAKACEENLSDDRLGELAANRKLPAAAFRGYGLGWNGDRYTVPVQSSKGRVVDIRLLRLGGKLLSTPTASTGLFNVRDLVDPGRVHSPVYICEGEWDAIAFRWMLGRLEKQGAVVGVPGAGSFKDVWVPLFQDREVVVLYDNDQAGVQGELRVTEKLTGTARRIRYLHWDPNLPEGADVRDIVAKIAVSEGKPEEAWTFLQSGLRDKPRAQEVSDGVSSEADGRTGDASETVVLDPISNEELIAVYKKWLHMGNIDALKVMYGAVMANKLEGDPVWLFLVAPPGGMKSELLMSLSKSEITHAISSLTPHTLISGASWKEGGDPSLLPKLGGKILIIKDFTTLLTMNYVVRDEIFGTLRDVYDGHTEKVFGNGIRRKYSVHFGVLAGVTPAIETFNVVHQSLGERFLKFRISGNWDQNSEEEKILRALKNIGREDRMRGELQMAGARWLAHAELPEQVPHISEDYMVKLVHLAKFSARLRGVVERDKFTGNVLYKPSSEVGTRIAKQLAKLGQGIGMFLGKKAMDEEVYKLIRRTSLDTVPDRVEDIVRTIWQITGGRPEASAATQDISGRTRLPPTTVFRVLQDMNLLKIVEAGGVKGQSRWKMSDKLTEHIQKAEIYHKKEDPEAPKPSGKLKIGGKA